MCSFLPLCVFFKVICRDDSNEDHQFIAEVLNIDLLHRVGEFAVFGAKPAVS